MSRRLARTPIWRLDRFIEDHLLPDTTFLTEVRADIDSICAFLTERCFQGATHPVRVSRIVKGGWFNKYTMLKGRSEATLVVFLNNLTCFEDQLKRREEFTEEIWKHLCQLQQEKQFKLNFEVQSTEQPDSRTLSIKLSSPQLQQEVEFDVQPAYDVLYELRDKDDFNPDNYREIYARLIRESTTLEMEGEFSVCFTDLHQNFLKYRAPKLWNIIRLVKHWYQLCKKRLKYPLPPQYALELLTVYAWERGLEDRPALHTGHCFRSVLDLITEYKKLRIYWTWCYEFKKETFDYLSRQIKKDRPVILDPADPTRNVAGSNIQSWHVLAKEAAVWARSSFFRNSDMTFVNGWKVSVRPLSPCTQTWVTPSLWRMILSENMVFALRSPHSCGGQLLSFFYSHFCDNQILWGGRMAQWVKALPAMKTEL
ncbi:2'-5' oligoadenylate synthetase 1E isoform X1 [Rattus norvegicus]|uniref:2'-5' oligoadenylate synthetase 1E isoform X1 n=1 Tax=Rattus norvegicus TaxID=10116 RepID=UPI0004E49161|eukprot:XP_008767470.1 PREDICTED: 2'-5' oligoadenylate synthetase 1E isoform X1 [Rattus norvegicus]